MKNKLRLRKAIKNVLDTKQNTVDEIPGLLGTLRNGKKQVKINGRKGFVYVRLHGKLTETVQAYNDQVLQLYDMPVLVKRVYGKGYHYYVTGKDTGKYENWGGNNAQAQYAQHGNQHSFGIGAGGSDVVWVFKKQFMPLLLYPYSGTAVRVTEDWYQWGDVYKHFTGSVVELGSAKPLFIGDARFVTLYMDGNSNTIKGVTGSLFTSTPFPADVTPYINVPTPSQGIPLSAVLLTSDTINIAWNNIYDDIRPIYGVGGGGEGSSSLTIYEQGIQKSSGTTAIDFGNGLEVTASGTVAYISTPIVSGTSTYIRAGSPVAESGITGTCWRIPEGSYATGTLSLFVNGVAQTPAIHFTEQYPGSGTFCFTDMPPTGSIFTAIWGAPVVGFTNAGGFSKSTYGCFVQRDSTQNIPNTTDVAIQFLTIIKNEENMFFTGSNTKLYAVEDGWYTIMFKGDWSANANGQRIFNIRLNGSDWILSISQAASISIDHRQCLAGTLYLTSGTYAECVAYQNSGGTRTLNYIRASLVKLP